MPRPRNNITKLPWDIREVVCRMRFDNASNAAIANAVRDACRERGIPPVPVHGSSILAYSRSDEYRRYCDRRRDWDERMAPRRWAASMLNAGAGPVTVADLAEMEILEQLHGLAAGGLLETGRDVATVARAITAMQRTQLMRRDQDADRRIEAERKAHEAELAARDATIAELRGEIERLRNDGRDVDAAAVAERMNQVLGVKK